MSRSPVGRVVRAAAGVVALLVLVAVAASAAELNTAELSGTVNNVTVEQGQTVSFQISLTASGTIRCTATPTNPATAKVDTHYTVDAAGTTASDTLSAPKPFYADAFCNVTWPGDPSPQAVNATVTTDLNTPVGDHAIRLHTVTTTPAGSGSLLQDATPTLVTFHVVPASDRTPPTVSCTGPTGTTGTNGWYTSEVSYGCTASDGQSGLADPSDASFTLATTGDGLDSTPSRIVKDKAGNTTTAGPFGPFHIDTVAPTVSCGDPTGAAGLNGWFTSAVTVGCTASDAVSGLADPSDSSFILATNGEGPQSITAHAVKDVAGNSSSTGSFGPFDVDLTDPSVTLSSPADGATFILGSDETVAYSCADTPAGSGVDSCAGTVANGTAIDTSSVGDHTVTVEAIDHAGRHTTVTNTYSVVYDFTDLSTPPGKSTPKAGGAVPVWFSLDGISDPSVVTAIESAPCGDGPFSTVAMNGPLRYDSSADRFMFVWKTDKAWAGSCRTLRISLNDGTIHSVSFSFN